MAPCLGQVPPALPSPDELGLVLPDVPALPGGDRRALVLDDAGMLTVGEVYSEVGDRLVLLMPDGRLESVATRDATLTDRPFEPVDKDEIARRLVETRFAGFKTRSTRRYVYVYNTSDDFFESTSRILETMFPNLYAYCRRLGIEVHDPPVPLVVVMFRTQEEFRAFSKMPDGVAAYYNTVSNWVVMYEQSQLNQLAPEIARKESISTIAHEGVHQVLQNIGVQHRLSRWPMWIGEGLPEYFAPTSAERGVRWKGVGLVNDLRMRTLQDFLQQSGASIGNGEAVSATIEAESLTATGYAWAWALTHYLAERQKTKFGDYLAGVAQLDAMQSRTAAEEAHIIGEQFGMAPDELEAEVIKHIKGLKYVDPIKNQSHYVAMLEWPGVRQVMLTTSPTAAQKWRQESIGKLPANLRRSARYAVKKFASRAAAERFIAGLANSR